MSIQPANHQPYRPITSLPEKVPLNHSQEILRLLKAGPSAPSRTKTPDRPRQQPTPTSQFKTTRQPDAKPAERGYPPRQSEAATAQAKPRPQTPDAGSVIADKVGKLLNRDSVIQMLREPFSMETRSRLSELRTLLSPANIRTMQNGPNAAGTIRQLNEFKTLLSQTNLEHLQDTAAAVEVPGLSKNEIRSRMNTGDPEADFRASQEVEQELRLEEVNIKQRKRDSAGTAKALSGLGQSLNTLPQDTPTDETPSQAKPTPENNPPIQTTQTPQPRDNPPAQGSSQTFTFGNIGESILAAPSEVMNFAHGRDKLDVSGVRAQLGNKPLDLVENFSGASGEMQIHYLPGTHTSVVMIAGDPGKPPFVVKVFGEVTYSDLVT